MLATMPSDHSDLGADGPSGPDASAGRQQRQQEGWPELPACLRRNPDVW